jgi:hypothetical protein
LRIPETFEIHREILDWKARHSPDRMPAKALGLDRPTLAIMRWAMRDRRRLERLNRFLGTASARLQMDYLPGLFCAAHFAIQAELPAEGRPRLEKLLAIGQALQRFWLTATHLGLAMQPSLAPLAFLHLARSGAEFSTAPWSRAAGRKLLQRAAGILPEGGARTIFMGRIGEPRSPVASRSVRLPLELLLLDQAPA